MLNHWKKNYNSQEIGEYRWSREARATHNPQLTNTVLVSISSEDKSKGYATRWMPQPLSSVYDSAGMMKSDVLGPKSQT